MDLSKLEKEIKELGLEESNINVGTAERYDGYYNLIRIGTRRWEFFYGTDRAKTFRREFKTQTEACEYFLQIIKKNRRKRKKDGKTIWYLRPMRYKMPILYMVMCIISSLLGVALAVGCYIQTGADWVFWCSVGWAVVFAGITVCLNFPKALTVIAKIAVPLFWAAYIALLMFIMAFGLVYFISAILDGYKVWQNLLALIMTEVSCCFFAAISYRFFLKEHTDQIISFFRKLFKLDKE